MLKNTRLAAVRRKLAAGAPVCIRSIGGSVTLGAKLAPDDTPFPAELFRLLNATYPHAAHDFDSFGGGGFGSKFYSSCLDSYVPSGCDLVIFDVAVNDITGSDAMRRQQLERVVGASIGPPLNVSAVLVANWYVRDGQGSATAYPKRNAIIAREVARDFGIASLDLIDYVTLFPLNTTAHFWASDGRHPSADGHRLIARAIARTVLGTRPEPRRQHADAYPQALARRPPGSSSVAPRYSSLCFIGARLAQVVAGAIPAGWRMVDEGAANQPKWGLVSHTLGASMALTLNRQGVTQNAVLEWGNRTIRHGAAEPVQRLFGFTNDVFFIELGYLASYGDYGEFRVSCLPKASCRCKKAMPWWPFPTVRTRMENARASVWGSTIAKVQGGVKCLESLQVVITSRSASKVKLLGLNLHPFNFPF